MPRFAGTLVEDGGDAQSKPRFAGTPVERQGAPLSATAAGAPTRPRFSGTPVSQAGPGILTRANTWLNSAVAPVTREIDTVLAPLRRGNVSPSALPPGREPAQAPSTVDQSAAFAQRQALEATLKAAGKDPSQDRQWQALTRQIGKAQANRASQASLYAMPLESGIAGAAERAIARPMRLAQRPALAGLRNSANPASGAGGATKSENPTVPTTTPAAGAPPQPQAGNVNPPVAQPPAGPPTRAPAPLEPRPPGKLRQSYVVNAIERAVSPSTVSPEAISAGATIRAGAGKLAQDSAVAEQSLKRARAVTSSMPAAARLDFIDAIESGRKVNDPQLAGVATALRNALEDRKRKIQSLGKGYLDSAIENYFPHVWQSRRGNPARTPLEAETARGQSKAPFKGSGAFRKQRVFQTTKEGIAAGFTPVSTDPVDLTLLKLREMDKFYYGEQTLRQLMHDGLARRIDLGDAAPQGWVKLNDPSVSKLPYNTYAPADVARVFNHYVSRGLVGEPIYDILRHAGNSLNQLQLGLSFFHAAFTSLDTMISQVARGIENVTHGDIVRGAGQMARGVSPTTVFTTARKGAKLRQAYLNPMGATPEMQRMMDALTEAGGRVTMDQFYAASATRGFIDSLRNGRLLREAQEQFREAPVRTLLAQPFKIATSLVRDISHPVMEWLVPRQKLGVFYDMAGDWLKRYPDADRDTTRQAMQGIWDSVDNRLGQMAYDNLFWNKVGKDLAFLVVRSVGWNLGTIRELGGGGLDALRFVAEATRGKTAPQFTRRMAYMIAMPIVTGLYGAITQYLLTGQPPQSPLDYFFPRTGRLTPRGDPERVSIPSYMKDVFAFHHSMSGTALSKLHPGLEALVEMVNNRDFYGGLIRDPDKSYLGQAGDLGRFALGQAVPFSITSAARQLREGGGAGSVLRSAAGLQPAPAYIVAPQREAAYEQRSDAEARRRAQREVEQGLR